MWGSQLTFFLGMKSSIWESGIRQGIGFWLDSWSETPHARFYLPCTEEIEQPTNNENLWVVHQLLKRSKKTYGGKVHSNHLQIQSTANLPHCGEHKARANGFAIWRLPPLPSAHTTIAVNSCGRHVPPWNSDLYRFFSQKLQGVTELPCGKGV